MGHDDSSSSGSAIPWKLVLSLAVFAGIAAFAQNGVGGAGATVNIRDLESFTPAIALRGLLPRGKDITLSISGIEKAEAALVAAAGANADNVATSILTSAKQAQASLLAALQDWNSQVHQLAFDGKAFAETVWTEGGDYAGSADRLKDRLLALAVSRTALENALKTAVSASNDLVSAKETLQEQAKQHGISTSSGIVSWITGSGPLADTLFNDVERSAKDLQTSIADVARRLKPIESAKRTVEALRKRKPAEMKPEEAIKTSRAFHEIDIHMRQVKAGWA